MSFRPPTLEDAAEIVRPINMALLKDLRASAFLETVRVIARELAQAKITRSGAAAALHQAIKDVEK